LRRDRRLQHTFSADYVPIISSAEDNQLSPFEIAAEQVYQEELFTQLAHEIAHFPAKQRTALLIDLANRIHFDTELTPLRKVFLAEGIDLQLYQRPLPNDPIERAKQAALTSLAYKRVAIRMHEHTLDK
jgi:hypothetical protein